MMNIIAVLPCKLYFQDFGSLQTAIETASKDRGLQPTPAFVTKVEYNKSGIIVV
jgi:hypothetical protein